MLMQEWINSYLIVKQTKSKKGVEVSTMETSCAQLCTLEHTRNRFIAVDPMVGMYLWCSGSLWRCLNPFVHFISGKNTVWADRKGRGFAPIGSIVWGDSVLDNDREAEGRRVHLLSSPSISREKFILVSIKAWEIGQCLKRPELVLSS